MHANEINVLIVEDDAIIRRGYVELLSAWGFMTRAAQNGLAALAQLQRAKPDILLSDLNMPGMNGYELLSIVRRIYPDVRTVAMSGDYTGHQLPPGVAADAFYPKGGGEFSRLLAILGDLARPSSTGSAGYVQSHS